jgi:hypothetical protein
MIAQWKNIAFWVGAILVIVLATFLYQPAAAKTGSLLVWTRNRVYVMDIDTLALQRVAPATANQSITPSPGCFGQIDAPCWVLIDEVLYYVDLTLASSHRLQATLPIGEGFRWNDGAVSWSPDGVHVTYSVTNGRSNQAELRIYSATTSEIKRTIAADVDSSIAVAWSPGCASGLEVSGCELGFKKMTAEANGQFSPALVGFTPATEAVRQWVLSPEPIFELRWSTDGRLLYSRPKRHFIYAEDNALANQIPPGGQLASVSLDAYYTVYYQPFTLEGCQSQNDDNRCLHLGVWLTPGEVEERSLIYSVDLSEEDQFGGLNFIPTWSPKGDSFVFFQQGRVVHYNLTKHEGTIWYKSVRGKLRSIPIFSPNEESVAFVDNQGQGFSEYRLVVVNPRLQPVEHIIQTQNSFRLLAWLPN